MSKKKDQIGLFFMPKNGILGSAQLYISGFSVASQLLGFPQLNVWFFWNQTECFLTGLRCSHTTLPGLHEPVQLSPAHQAHFGVRQILRVSVCYINKITPLPPQVKLLRLDQGTSGIIFFCLTNSRQ